MIHGGAKRKTKTKTQNITSSLISTPYQDNLIILRPKTLILLKQTLKKNNKIL